jgi:hypothetical protein
LIVVFVPEAGRWIIAEDPVAMTNDREGRAVAGYHQGVKSVADISAFSHGVMNWRRMLLQNWWLFWDIPR